MDEALDPFRITDELEDVLLEVMALRLEVRGNHPFFQKVLREYLDAMRIDAAATVLDMGCGTGVAARTIARRKDFSGKVTGIDLSPYLVDAAERLADEEGLGGRVEFRSGDTRDLDIPDGNFDAVVAHTLVSHVGEVLAVLEEAGRGLKPDGLIAIFDGDYASMTFALEDPLQSKKYDEALIDALVTSPRVMRQMPRLIRRAGLEMVGTFSYVMAEVGEGDFWLSAVDAYEKLAPKSGVISEAEATDWANALHRTSDEDVFFGASNYYTYIARCPENVRYCGYRTPAGPELDTPSLLAARAHLMRSLSDRWIDAPTNNLGPTNVTSSLRRTFYFGEWAQYQPVGEGPPEVARSFQDDPPRPYGTHQLEVAYPHLGHRHGVGAYGEINAEARIM